MRTGSVLAYWNDGWIIRGKEATNDTSVLDPEFVAGFWMSVELWNKKAVTWTQEWHEMVAEHKKSPWSHYDLVGSTGCGLTPVVEI